MIFADLTINQVLSIFEAGFKCLESREVSPFQKKDDKILITHSGCNQVFYLYFEKENRVTHKDNGEFIISYPFKSFASLSYGYNENENAVNFIQFTTSRMMFNQLSAINQMKLLGINLDCA